MAQLSYIDQLPAITEGMIRILPSYTINEPITLEQFGKIRAGTHRNPNLKVSDIIAKIQDNIKLVKGDNKVKLQETLDIQLAIIEHGYEGICTSTEATKIMVANMKQSISNGYKPRFEI